MNPGGEGEGSGGGENYGHHDIESFFFFFFGRPPEGNAPRKVKKIDIKFSLFLIESPPSPPPLTRARCVFYLYPHLPIL